MVRWTNSLDLMAPAVFGAGVLWAAHVIGASDLQATCLGGVGAGGAAWVLAQWVPNRR